MPAKMCIVIRCNCSRELIVIRNEASSMTGALWDLSPVPASLNAVRPTAHTAGDRS
jgi:hypothetical protein